MKYIKAFESFKDLYNKLKPFSYTGDENIDSYLRQLKVLAQVQNLKRLSGESGWDLSEEFRFYFLDMIDEGWSYMYSGGEYCKQVSLRKDLKTENAEKELDNIVDRMSEIRDRLGDEDFRSNFIITFGDEGQQDNNPVTHRNDDYKFKGVGKEIPDKPGYFHAYIRLDIV